MVEEATVICDLSGSMMECGKRFIMRTVLRTISQYYQMLNPGADLRLVTWRDIIEDIEWNPESGAPETLMECSGRSCVEALRSHFGERPSSPILILTDGYWDDQEADFYNRADAIDENCLRVVLVGADSNPNLKGNYVFTSDEILSALEKFGD